MRTFIFILLSMSIPLAYANKYSEKREAIFLSATKICSKILTNGAISKVVKNSIIRKELETLQKELSPSKSSPSSSAAVQEYTAELQTLLANELKSQRHCRSEVFNKLLRVTPNPGPTINLKEETFNNEFVVDKEIELEINQARAYTMGYFTISFMTNRSKPQGDEVSTRLVKSMGKLLKFHQAIPIEILQKASKDSGFFHVFRLEMTQIFRNERPELLQHFHAAIDAALSLAKNKPDKAIEALRRIDAPIHAVPIPTSNDSQTLTDWYKAISNHYIKNIGK